MYLKCRKFNHQYFFFRIEFLIICCYRFYVWNVLVWSSAWSNIFTKLKYGFNHMSYDKINLLIDYESHSKEKYIFRRIYCYYWRWLSCFLLFNPWNSSDRITIIVDYDWRAQWRFNLYSFSLVNRFKEKYYIQ
jgi:hypothetical protein